MIFFFFILLRPPCFTRTDPLFPYATLLRYAGDAGERDAVDDEILAIYPAAFANPGQPGRNQQGEAFAHHAGRAVEFADGAPVRGAIAGFLLKLALRRDLRSQIGRAHV